jgi:hypothetical protein
VLAAAPDDRVRDGARAVSIMTDLWKTQRTPAMAETMAMGLAEMGRFPDAIEWQRTAIDGAKQVGRPEMIPALTANLRLYEQRQPCRTPWAENDPVFRPGAAQ